MAASMSEELQLVEQIKIQCSLCDEEHYNSEMTTWSASKYCCTCCKSNYNRQTTRCQTNSALRSWWKKLPDDERRNWYVVNRKNYEPNKRIVFNNPGFYAETEAKQMRGTTADNMK